MFLENLSQFVVEFIQNNKNPNVSEAWFAKKNQEALCKIIKKNNITVKDPNKPKRGKSGYLYFCAEYREKMKAENPDLTVKEIVSKLGILWKQMKTTKNPEVKRFEQMSIDDRNRYKSEMNTYVPILRKLNKKEKKNKKDNINDDDIDVNETEKPKKSRKKEDDGYNKYVRSKKNKTKKTHPELDSDGIIEYLKQKWSKFPQDKKDRYKNKK
jgi:hypothetical protein